MQKFLMRQLEVMLQNLSQTNFMYKVYLETSIRSKIFNRRRKNNLSLAVKKVFIYSQAPVNDCIFEERWIQTIQKPVSLHAKTR